MESESAQQETINTTQPESSARPTSKRRRIFTIIIAIVIVFIISLSSVVLTKQLQNPSPEASLQVVPQQQNRLVTEETLIAKSLEVPLLYPDAEWVEIEEDFQINDGLNNISALSGDEIIFIPTNRGTFWRSKFTQEYPMIDTYYLNVSEEQGWSGKIKFSSFDLYSVAADGPCGGVNGYVGYKNGLVRFIAVAHLLSSCKRLPDENQMRSVIDEKNEEAVHDYTIFVSEPISLEEIDTYITSEASGN